MTARNYSNNGKALTVSKLRQLLATWPTHRADGEPTQVWLGKGNGLTNEAVEVSILNQDAEGVADLLLDIREGTPL